MGDTVGINTLMEASESISKPVEVEKKTTLDSPPGFVPLASSLEIQSNHGVDLVNLAIEKVEAGKISNLRDNSVEMAVGENVSGEKGSSSGNKIDGAWLVKFAAVTTTTTKTETPFVETVKRKRGRPFKNKVAFNSPVETVGNGTNGVSPSVPTPNSNEMTLQDIAKRKVIKPPKMKRGWQKRKTIGKVVSSESSPAPSSAPAQLAIEMSSAELVKKRRGRQPKMQKDHEKGSEEAVSSESSLSRKGGGRWPNKQNGLNKKEGTKEPVSLEPSLPTAAASPRSEMSLRETARRKAGRITTPKRKYERKKRTTATGHASGMETNKQLALPGEAVTKEPDQDGEGMSTPSKRGKKQKIAQQVDSSREQMVTDKDITGLQSTFYVGDVPIPGEYEQIYKDIKNRHGPLENNQPVGPQDGLPHITLVELLKMAHSLKTVSMNAVTETTLSEFGKLLAVGKIFNYNVGWLEENLKHLRELYTKRAALDVGTLEQDVQSVNAWLEATQVEFIKMEEAYLSAKQKVNDLVKSRDDAVAKLIAARDRVGTFEFVI